VIYADSKISVFGFGYVPEVGVEVFLSGPGCFVTYRLMLVMDTYQRFGFTWPDGISPFMDSLHLDDSTQWNNLHVDFDSNFIYNPFWLEWI